jgi:hypothetical protein
VLETESPSRQPVAVGSHGGDDRDVCIERELLERTRDARDALGLVALLGALPALLAQLVGLDAQHLRDGHAVPLGLGDGNDEVAHVGDVGALQRLLRSSPPRHADADVLEGVRQLVPERAAPGGRRACQCRFEAEARLHADRDLVEHVGQLPLDHLLAFPRLRREQHVGDEEPDHRRRGTQQDRGAGWRGQLAHVRGGSRAERL